MCVHALSQVPSDSTGREVAVRSREGGEKPEGPHCSPHPQMRRWHPGLRRGRARWMVSVRTTGGAATNWREEELPESRPWTPTGETLADNLLRDLKEAPQGGVASIALKAALDSIKNKGGGTVEAYPITHWSALASWFGTEGMFRDEGFKVVVPFGKSAVLMRRRV